MIERVSDEATEGGRVPALDGLRGVAILLVMALHLYGLVYVFDGDWEPNAIDSWFAKAMGAGWMGVDLFFVLSGFLITGILLDAKDSSTYFRSFYARRVLRIFPLYYAFIVFMLVVAPRFDLGDSASLRDNQVWYWTYLTNVGFSFDGLASAAPFANGHAHLWSLAVEEQFYLVWPFVVLALGRRMLTALVLAMIPVALFIRLFLISDLAPGGVQTIAAYSLMPARFDTLALGALLAIGFRSEAGLEPWRRYALPVIGVALAVLAALFVTQDGLSFIDRDVQAVGFTATAMLFGGVVLYVVSAPPGGTALALLSFQPLRLVGKYSYALYVVHPVIAQTISRRIAERYDVPLVFGSQIPLSVAIALVCGVVSAAAAWLSWHVLERHVLKLKRFFPYGEQQRSPDTQAVHAVAAVPEPELATTTT